MTDKLIGHMVIIIKDDPWTGKRGEVVCCVREGRVKEYIVQFKNTWCYFRAKNLKVAE